MADTCYKCSEDLEIGNICPNCGTVQLEISDYKDNKKTIIRDSPIKMLERFEAEHGTYSNIVDKFIAADTDLLRARLQHKLKMHASIQHNIVMYNLEYKHGLEDSPTKQ